MATHSSTCAWEIPWMEEPGRLQSMGLWRVGHDWATSLSLFTFSTGEGNGNPLQYSCLENPRDGSLVGWIYGVAQSRTWLSWLSSSSCFIDYAKAFDCVDHNKMWKILKETGIPDHLTCLLRNLNAGQEATVRIGHGTIDWLQIGKGVHQDCILSPCLFNLYA